MAERCCVPGPAQGVTWVLSLLLAAAPILQMRQVRLTEFHTVSK